MSSDAAKAAALPAGRYGQDDWLRLGLEQLAREGPEGLTIDRLCGRAGKTKGSFYHHFRDQAAFIAAMLDYWQEFYLTRVIKEAERGKYAGARRAALDSAVGRLDYGVEIGMRRLAAVDPLAKEVTGYIDRRRIDYLAEINAEDFKIGETAARRMAEIEYAAFIGALFVFPDEGRSWLDAMRAQFIDGLPPASRDFPDDGPKA